MITEVTTEAIREALDKLQATFDLLPPKFSRQYYNIAKDCLWFCDNFPDYDYVSDPKAKRLMLFSMHYFLLVHRQQEASRICQTGMKNLSAHEILRYHLKEHRNRLGDSRCRAKYIISANTLITFLAKIGYESEILGMELKTLADPGAEYLRDALLSSWVCLFDRFRQRPAHGIIDDIYNTCNRLANGLSKLDASIDQAWIVEGRKWILTRQMLAVYAAIALDISEHNVISSNKYPNFTKIVNETVLSLFDNYFLMLADLIRNYIANARKAEVAARKFGHYIDECYAECLVDRIERAPKRFSDVMELLRLGSGVAFRLDLKGRLREGFEPPGGFSLTGRPSGQAGEESKSNRWFERLELWLDDVGKKVERKVFHLLDSNEKNTKARTIGQLREILEASLSRGDEPSFWSRCRVKFNEARLDLAAASINNTYAVESAFVFKAGSIDKDRGLPSDTEMLLMKKYGSTTAIFERQKDIAAGFGGGFFLYHKGFGLAIDPGPDFLRNLNRFSDFDVFDIHGIVCTHTHYDHFADFQRIVLGIREIVRNVGGRTLYFLLPDPDDKDMYPDKLREEFVKDVFVPGKTTYYFPDNEWGRKHGIRVDIFGVTHEIYNRGSLSVRSGSPSPTSGSRHGIRALLQKISAIVCGRPEEPQTVRTNSYGLSIFPLESPEFPSIVYTGDAEYDGAVLERSGITNPDILIMNTSSIRLGDIIATNHAAAETQNVRFKRNHLGYSGMLSLLRDAHSPPKISVIEEYYEPQSESDTRSLITDALSSDAPVPPHSDSIVLAGETGLRLRFKSGIGIYCSAACGNEGFVYNRASVRQVRSGNYEKRRAIEISCGDCEELMSRLGYSR